MRTHLTHWGAFEAETDGERLTSVKPWHGDAEPSGIIHNVASAQHHPARISQPYVRKGWLENGPGAPGRGEDEFVPVDWNTALDLLAGELRRVYGEYGGEAVYGGSYGWGSAGRFHHAQSQVHRFLNTLGGYVRRVNSYSFTVSEVLLPHVVSSLYEVLGGATAWDVVAEHSELIVAFGGISPKNAQVNSGGIARHELRRPLAAAKARGCRVVSVSPLRDDTPDEAGAEWLAPRPGSDAAIMLALAHVLDAEDLADKGFLDRFTVGYDKFISYVRGESDGVAKTPEWAAELSEIPADDIRALARDMAAKRTLLMVSWSLQRTQYGEQPLWLGVVLSAMLGQIGLPGGGFGHGYGSTGDIGKPYAQTSAPALPQGKNEVKTFIPVARISDMLLNPGGEFEYDGGRYTYPDIKLVYWCGGNPFHHHQDLARLHEAFKRPDTVVVHDPFWTSSARHADFVMPSTMTIERDDYGAGSGDSVFMPMKALTKPHGQTRDDYDIFAALAHRLGRGEAFTEGRTANEWLRHLYDNWRERLQRMGTTMPSFEEFWESEHVEIPIPDPGQVLYSKFRADPEANPLRTPSGKIEIFSEKIDSFGYEECPGHPVWMEPAEWLAGPRAQHFPLHLIANQPKTRLHSQLDVGAHSQASKVDGREPLRIHPDDAAARGLADGELARVFNDRGSCLVGVRVSDNVRPGVVQLSTGAWYDPDPTDASFCRHGNVNVLTPDEPSSRLSQGCIGQHALVEIEPVTGEVPEVTVTRAPA
ncbi:molybdopterin-dependent oxidoreductase [Stackebrandtia nassauensis]|uniref:Molybdopterin oxidoreductase n=1 Tax=Stackebrandtia nassauensis (strain DSM 44728 / CIP 108903 / NRRL B-16338 / NBRC 102104 / LLR-40K-21) TaxID=446470 RepID=D3PZG4_STANL|nr:molybdopterin-dependent oxidoreductase [Stackebrandtia nassauensis]ADD41638.1 molybdopterin oxidoreductase [Stackebrandtia nassauensis DSM 44728]